MRILALVAPGTNARPHFCDLLRGAQMAGHDVLLEDLTPFISVHQQAMQAAGGRPDQRINFLRVSFARYLESLYKDRQCDLMMGLWADPLMMLPVANRPDGTKAAVTAMMGIPMIHYWIDSPFWAYDKKMLSMFDRSFFTNPLHIHAVNNPATADEMRRILNFQSVIDQSYGVDEVTFRPWADVPQEYDLALTISPSDPRPTPLMLEQLTKDQPDLDAIRRDQMWTARASVSEAFRTTEHGRTPEGEALIDALLEEQLRDPDRPMLQKFEAACAAAKAPPPLIDALTAQPASPRIWSMMSDGVRQLDSWRRPFHTAFLSQRFKCLILGTSTSEGWDIKGDRAGNPALHEISLYYTRCRAALNVMRYQDDIGLNPRLFEIASSGCVPLQCWRQGIDELFNADEEILTHRSPAEAAEQLTRLNSDKDRCDSMRRAARARVLQSHTWRHRSAELLQKAADLPPAL